MLKCRRLLCVFTISSILFGAFGEYIDAAPAQDVIKMRALAQTEDEANPDDGWVEVEPTNLLPSDITGVYYLIPYRNRRDKWGQTYSIGYSSFNPANYEPNFGAFDFADIYTTAEMPLIEIQGTLKRNFTFGSIGAELGVGFYQNDSDSEDLGSDLELIPIRLGLNLSLDNLYHEPYIVPYGMVGAYIVMYEENLESTSFGGNTQVAPYYGAGIAFQLNWVDRESARISYLESGIENTFVYLEMRKFIASGAAADPDFSTGFDWGAGVRLEF